MKKITKLFVIGLLAASTTLTSCIDNAVAPEVTALRAAQVAYVEAQARLEAADAEAQEILNAYNEALNAIKLQEAQSDLELALATNAALTLQAQADLETARLNLQVALDDLADYLATNGLDQAAEYLADYSDAMDDVYDTSDDILSQIAYIADLQIALDNGSYDLARSMIQRNLDRDEAELAVWEATLAAVEAVKEDPSTSAAALGAAYAAIVQLENDYQILDQERDIFKETDVDPAWDAYVMTVGGSSSNGNVFYSDPSAMYASAQADVIGYNSDIVDYEENIAFWLEQAAENAIYRATQEVILEARGPEAEAYRATADDLYVDYLAAEVVVELALSDLQAADLTDDQLLEDYFDLQNARFDAEDDYFDAIGERNFAEQALVNAQANFDANEAAFDANLTAAESDLTAAETDLDAAQDAYDLDPTQANLDDLNIARNDVDNANFAVGFWEEAIADLDGDLADAEVNVPLAEAALTTATSALNAAEAAEAAALAAFEAANEAIQPVLDVYLAALLVRDEADDAYSEADNIADNAENLVDNAENNIEGSNYADITYEETINNIEQNLAETIGDLAEAEAEVLKWEELANLTEVEIGALYAEYLAAQTMYLDMDDELKLIQDQIAGQWTIANAIENNLDDLNAEIDNILDTIEGLQESIAEHQEDLATEDLDEAELIAIIANEEGYLAQLQEELAAYQALAAQYLALFNAALAG